jgi:ABC-type phosphate/phosphonate transport system substrate-binding protein
MSFIAALPMYDWPETRAETDAQWHRLRAALRAAGIDAPQRLTRRNADMPAMPGGIRGRDGGVTAPDPATLPPDEFDFPTLWRHPDLLLGQACWGPMEFGLAAEVEVVGQPRYDDIEGGQGIFYSSALAMRGDCGDHREASPEARLPFHGVSPPADGAPAIPLDLLRGRRLAFNGPDSMSGILALVRDLEAMGESLETVFPERIETGAHRASIVAVAEGRADVAAIDCRSWHLARRHEPKAAGLRVVGWTALRKGLPFITSRHTPPETVTKLIEILGRP